MQHTSQSASTKLKWKTTIALEVVNQDKQNERKGHLPA